MLELKDGENRNSRYDKRDVEAKIAEAIARSPYKWRTPRTIARELKLTEREVASTLRQADSFLQARQPNARGEPLYTTVSRYQAETPLWKRILGAAANTVAE